MKLLLIFIAIGIGLSACSDGGESIPFPDEKEIQRQDAYDDDQYKEQRLLP